VRAQPTKPAPRGALAGLVLLLALLWSIDATAQTPMPATLRLVQVVPRLPIINLYAIAQDEGGQPLPMRSDLSAMVGSRRVPVELAHEPDTIGIVFLIDISASLRPAQYEMIRSSVRRWIDALGPGDRAAIVTFGSSVTTVVDFTADKTTLREALARLTFKDQRTLLYQGLVQAIDLSRRLDRALPLRRAIVVPTDGQDDQQGGAGRQEVVDKLALDPTPIYGIGASGQTQAANDALKDFAALVRDSGGDYRRVDPTGLRTGAADLGKDYTALKTIVDSTQHLTASCDTCPSDGSALVVRLFLAEGTTRLNSAGVTVRAVGSEGTPTEPRSRWADLFAFLQRNWEWLVTSVLVIVGSGGAAWALRRPAIGEVGEREPIRPPVDPPPVSISTTVAVEPGTQLQRQRLRLFPLGHNDLPPQDALFERDLTVGRSPDSDICIGNDRQVSASHCTLSPRDGRVFVRDDGSRNGTRINGVAVDGFMHAEADSILGVGRTELRMQLLPVGRS